MRTIFCRNCKKIFFCCVGKSWSQKVISCHAFANKHPTKYSHIEHSCLQFLHFAQSAYHCFQLDTTDLTHINGIFPFISRFQNFVIFSVSQEMKVFVFPCSYIEMFKKILNKLINFKKIVKINYVNVVMFLNVFGKKH